VKTIVALFNSIGIKLFFLFLLVLHCFTKYNSRKNVLGQQVISGAAWSEQQLESRATCQ
jgi:hypothetical protein